MKIFSVFIFILMLSVPLVHAGDTQKALNAISRGDYKTAFEIWLSLAKRGNNAAQFNLGLMYDKGDGVNQDFSKAVKWYRLAAIQGNADAQLNLGLMYYNGVGVPKNYKRAARWYLYSARQGNLGAQFNLGWMYDKGEGVIPNYKRALKWYKLAAKQGHGGAQYNLGLMYDNGDKIARNFQKTLYWYLKAGKQGNAEAQFELAKIYDQGIKTKQDSRKAIQWYKLAAKKGKREAQFRLGRMYVQGKGILKNYASAATWFRRAAVQEHPNAQFNLGLLYESGDGVERDSKKAAKWYLLAAEQDHGSAQANLAWMYLNGIGVEEDLNEAEKWYRRAEKLEKRFRNKSSQFKHAKDNDLRTNTKQDSKRAIKGYKLAGPTDSKEKKRFYKSQKLSLSIGLWISTGKTSWNHDSSGSSTVAGNPTSELTYEDLDSNIIELEAELRLPRKVFLRTQFGFGAINSGRLVNDDFVSAAGATFFSATQTGEHRISRTFSDIGDDSLWYLNLDLGYTLRVSRTGQGFLRGFVGYQHWQEKAVAKGLEQIECTSVGNFCNAVGTISNVGEKVITNEVRWDSLRIGLEGSHWFNRKLRFDIDLAFIPFSSLLNQDTHHLRTDLQQDPSFEMDGTGTGYNIAASLKYQFTKGLSFSAGYKYWEIEVSDGTWKNFPVTGSQTVATLNDLFSYRHGLTAKFEYTF
ncbi:MAG TPA: hypothetical protein EYO37_01705 [Nitrospina sp.]|nr:hypothetical protein [Nitrospina sp.]